MVHKKSYGYSTPACPTYGVGESLALSLNLQSWIVTGIKGKVYNCVPLKVQEKDASQVRRSKITPDDVGMQVSIVWLPKDRKMEYVEKIDIKLCSY